MSFLVTYKLSGVSTNVRTDASMSVEGLYYPLKLTMTVNSAELSLGEHLNIGLLLENIGNETLTLYMFDGNDRFDFIIYDESGAGVYDYGKDTVYLQMHWSEQMKPSEIHSLTLEWGQVTNGIYDPNHDPHAYSIPVPAGTYKIMGAFDSNTLGFTVDTPVISFEISG